MWSLASHIRRMRRSEAAETEVATEAETETEAAESETETEALESTEDNKEELMIWDVQDEDKKDEKQAESGNQR